MALTRPTVAQLNTIVVELSDPISVLNKGSTQANVDVGFVFNRDGGTSANVALYWNETTDSFNLVSTTSTGGINSNIAVSDYSDLRIRDLTGNTASFSGNGAIKIPTGNTAQRTAGTTGEIRFNTTTSQFEGYQGTSWSSLGGVRSVDNATYIVAEAYPGAGNNALYFYTNNTLQGNLSSTGFNLTGNVLATAGTFNGLTVNGNESVTGYLNVTGNIMASAIIGASLNVSGNVLSAGAIHNSLTVNGATTQAGTLTVSSGFINSSGNILATGAIVNALTVNGNESVTGYLNVTGNVLATTAKVGSIEADGIVYANSTTTSTSTSTGALRVAGGIGVAGNVWADQIYASNNGNGTNFRVGDDLWIGDINVANTARLAGVQDGTQAYLRFGNSDTNSLGRSGTGPLTWTGSLNISGNVLSAVVTVGAVQTSGMIYANSTAQSSSATTGALVVAGGVGVGGNLYVTGNLVIQGNIISNSYEEIITGQVIANSTIAATSTSTGALQSYGGAGIQGTLVAAQLNSTGNLLAQGAILNALTVNGNETVTGYLNVTGNILAANVNASYFVGRGDALTNINAFGNVFVSGQSPVLADNTSDTLTLVGGTGIAITTDAANDSVTISTVSTTGPFAAAGDFGSVTDVVTTSEDEGDLTSTNSTTYDLGTLVAASGLIYPDLLVLPSYTVAGLPSAVTPAQIVYVSNESGGAVLAFSDGTNWRRVTDRAIVS